ncbi:MAG TPA: PKD domain-containing protein, partial [Bacteroidia bacterium]
MIKHIYLFLSLFTYSTSFCQIAASTLTGCVPVAVTFTGVVGATNPLWNFNDGATSPNNNPTHVFTTIGTHIVTYTATGISQQSLTITVHGKPTPRFRPTTSIEGCIPLTVSFKDSSSGGGNSLIQTWQWVFGDGGTTSGIPSTVTYTYVVAGEFDVSVKVTDANGCDSSLVKNNLVIVSQKPTMSLVTNPNPASACVPPLTVTFTAVGSISHSPLGAALTYSWNFGGGVTSTSATPTPQTYTASGAYPIYLQVTDANNCSNYTTTTVSIQSPTATFTSPNDTLCINVSTTFNSAGSTVGTQLWNYGDGTTGPIGTHTYTAPGHYYVLLKVTNGACSDTIGLSVFVQKPVANFSVTPTYMCSLPKTISLTNSSTPTSGTTYQWHYFQHYTQYSINPLTSNSVSSTFTITHLDTNRYAINTLNMMDSISLVITTAQGCISHKSFILIDTIYLPTARFITSFYQGCVPLTVNFADSSRVGPREHITSWKYIFGDGANTTIASAPGNSTHTYTNTGIYYPKLVIQTQDGCIDTSFAIKIEVGTPPNASFNAT